MKIIISSEGKTIKDDISEVFGRCSNFISVETKEGKIVSVEAFENKSKDQQTAAGIGAAKQVADTRADALISGNLGPRAKEVFSQFNIKTYNAKGNIEDAVNDLLQGKLTSDFISEKEGISGQDNKNTENIKTGNKEKETKKIAIPTNGTKGLEEETAMHFGRCSTYTFLNQDGELLEIIQNTSEHMGGTGLPPELMKQHKADVLICRGLGRRALDLFNDFGVEVFISQKETVKEMFEEYSKNNLEQAGEEDACSHNHEDHECEH